MFLGSRVYCRVVTTYFAYGTHLPEPEVNRQRQNQQCDQLILELSESDADYVHCLKRFSSGIALGITFGMDIHEAAAELPRVLANNDSLGSDVRFY
jgi:ornithine carbamoyltransferase